MKQILLYFLVITTYCLAGCNAPVHTENKPPPGVRYYQEKLPKLIDEATQTYRFEDGQCRSLTKLPPPWRLKRPAGDLSWRRGPNLDNTFIALEADTSAFDLEPPPEHRTGGDRQLIIDLKISTLSYRLPDNEKTSYLWKVLLSAEDIGDPVKSSKRISNSFIVYQEPGSSNQVYVDREIGMVIEDQSVEHMPNADLRGFMSQEDQAGGNIILPYEALPKLTEIGKSMQNAIIAIRVPCPLNHKE